MQCPKCSFLNSEGALECSRCGIVFEKYKKQQHSARAPQKPTPKQPAAGATKTGKGKISWKNNLSFKEIAIILTALLVFLLTMTSVYGAIGVVLSPVVMITSIWVYFDAKTIGVKKGQIKGLVDMGPWGWFFSSLFIWILGFPFYLSKRNVYKRVSQNTGETAMKCRDCGFEIPGSEQRCPNCGAIPVKKTRIMPYAIGGILLFIALSIFGGIVIGTMDPTGTTAGPQIVSYNEYRSIENGMSYQKVTSIIGYEGEEISHGTIEGVPGVMDSVETIMYQWMNRDGSNMNAMFQNDRLVQKAQFGLQ